MRTKIIIGLLATVILFQPQTSHSKDVSRQIQKCHDIAYVEIGEHILKVPRPSLFMADENDKLLYEKCESAVENPVTASRMAAVQKMTLPKYGEVLVQIAIDSFPNKHVDRLLALKKKLKSEGKTLENLPLEDGFYRYETGKKFHFKYYIGATKLMSEPDGTPLVLYPCPDSKKAFGCETMFTWKSLHIWIRPITYPKGQSLAVWEEYYPLLLKTLDEMNQSNN